MQRATQLKKAGQLIKELRQKQGFTGVSLGKRTGISQSRISKIENGLYHNVPSRDITKILNILNPSQDIRQQLLKAFATGAKSAKFNQYNPRMWDVFKYESKAKLIRIYMISGVPAILQTMDYRIAGLRDHFGATEDEITEILKDTMKRQDLLWDATRKYRIVLHQAALYSMRKDAATQLAQLDRIERIMDLPSVKIGIIPVEASLPAAEISPFALHGSDVVIKTSINGDMLSSDEVEVDTYTRLFGQLEAIAVYDEEAKRLIRRAMDYVGG